MRFLITLLVSFTLLTQQQVVAGGGLFRQRAICRSNVCAPIKQKVIVEEVVQPVVQDYYPPAQPIIIQNNYPPAQLELGQTLYGYQQAGIYSPFSVDPGEILREARALTQASQSLTSEALGVYQQLGTDALALAAQSDQLRARAELIRSSAPAQASSLNAQATTLSASQSIVLTPDGYGSFKIEMKSSEGHPPSSPGNGVPPQTPPADPQSAVGILQTSCAKCHTSGATEAGPELFDANGQLLNLSSEVKAKVVTTIKFGIMPPQPAEPLSDVDLAKVQVLFGE